jgi:1-acyl-sn-glycerol-3-phosphate acyltransferase
MQGFFTAIYDFFSKRKTLYWVCFALLFAICIAGASRIKFVDDVNKMIPHDKAIEAMNDVLSKTKTGEQVILSLSFSDTAIANPDSLIAAQQAFEEALIKSCGRFIKAVPSQVNDEKELQFQSLVFQYLPLFLEEQDYARMDTLLQPGQLKTTLEKEHRLLLSPAGMVAKQWIAQDPVGIMPIAFQKLQSLQFDPAYELYRGYIFSKDEKRLTFFIDLKYPAAETGKNAILFGAMDELLLKWKKDQPGIRITYFGGPAVAAGNASQMRQDTILTLSITVLLLLGLTYYVFRRKRSPLLLMVPVIFGAVFGLALTALLQGSVSVIALGAGAIILGIAIDFSVHFMSHARTHPDMRENVRTLASPLTLGAITTVGAFLALRLANAPILQDLGLFAAASLTGASLFTLIFLPHLLQSTGKPSTVKPLQHTFIDKLASLKPEGNKWLLLLVIAATPVFWYFARQVQFDGDLMHLNYLSPEMQQAQEEMNRNNAYALSSVFIVAKDTSAEIAAQKLEKVQGTIARLQQAGHIRNSINPVRLLPSEQEQNARLQRWKAFWTPERTSRTIALVRESGIRAGFSPTAFEAFGNTISQSYTTFDTAASNFLMQLLPNSISGKGNDHYAIAALKAEPGSRSAILDAFKESKAVIATDRQSVSERLLELLHGDFNKILFYSGALVFLALLIAYGRIELALISFLPMALTWVWILGIMALLGLKFNIVNIIISTLIFGLGDDYSIFMMNGLLEKYRTGKNKITDARSAVYLSVLTTIIGLGTLIFARHPALQSIAAIAVIGLICVVFVSQVLQPFLFNFMIQRRADKGFMPFSLWSLVKSAFSFLYFFTGCLLVTLAGLVLTGLRPLGKKKSKYLFHLILSKYTGSVMYVMANTRKNIVRLAQEDFSKPAVYIANHSSFLDILITTMLHPKLVLLTNKWVWRSPVFGKIVRMAEYYPVADGAEDSIEPLQDLVSRGYGIVVFPEGTRSYDDTIHRFHKGAFYLSEKLGLDIVPIVLHGVHYTMQKGDWLLKDGRTTITIHPHIRPEDEAFGTGYRERTKLISKWFRREFLKTKEQIETPRYFKEQIIKSYMYKGPVLEWYCRVKIKLEDYYVPFHQLLPGSGRFYDLGCGYGFMTYMLHWASEERKFTGLDYDEEKIITARNNYKRVKPSVVNGKLVKPVQESTGLDFHNPIDFRHADLTRYELQSCNGIIISDVLHYLLPEQQTQLLDRCYHALEKEGILIIRDGVEELKERHKGTKRTEILSTKIFNFNKTQNELHFLSRSFIEGWAAHKGMHLEVIDNTSKTSNLIFVLRK